MLENGVQGGAPTIVISTVMGPLKMAENKWVSLQLFHPTYNDRRGPPCWDVNYHHRGSAKFEAKGSNFSHGK